MNPAIVKPIHYAIREGGGRVYGQMYGPLKSPDPVLPLDAATKAYVDALNEAGGGPGTGDLDWHERPYAGGANTGWFGMLGANPLDSGLWMVRGLTYVTPIWCGINTVLDWDALAVHVYQAVASSVVRLGIYELDPDSGFVPSQLLLDAGTVDTSTTGTKILTGATLQTQDIRWLGLAAMSEATASGPRLKTIKAALSPWAPLMWFPSLVSTLTISEFAIRRSGADGDGALPTDFTPANWVRVKVVDELPHTWIHRLAAW